MIVVLASDSPIKKSALEFFLRTKYPSKEILVIPVSVENKIFLPEQPVGEDSIRACLLIRSEAAKEQVDEYDMIFAIENGIVPRVGTNGIVEYVDVCRVSYHGLHGVFGSGQGSYEFSCTAAAKKILKDFPLEDLHEGHHVVGYKTTVGEVLVKDGYATTADNWMLETHGCDRTMQILSSLWAAFV